MDAWQPISTAPRDGSEILLLTTTGVVSARFAPGEWSNGLEGREYSGAIWVCYDDAIEIEVEELPDGQFGDGPATHWMPLIPLEEATYLRSNGQRVPVRGMAYPHLVSAHRNLDRDHPGHPDLPGMAAEIERRDAEYAETQAQQEAAK